MSEEYMWYRVHEENNFYDGMVGKQVFITEKTRILEFKLNNKLGGLQRVQFFKEQLIYDGAY